MILRIYLILCIVLIFLGVVCRIFEIEKSRRSKATTKKISDVFDIILIVYVVLFTIYIVFMLIYGIIDNNIFKKIFFMVPTLSFIVTMIFGLLSEKFEVFDFLYNCVSGFSFIVWGLSSFFLCVSGAEQPSVEKSIERDYVKTIDILEFKEAPYTNVSGNRWYIKSTPGCAYYYEVATENNGTTTKVIDGEKHYVEKHESEKYTSNPHIEVYDVVESYTNWYDKECKEVVSTEYYIYIPENSIFYEAQ